MLIHIAIDSVLAACLACISVKKLSLYALGGCLCLNNTCVIF